MSLTKDDISTIVAAAIAPLQATVEKLQARVAALEGGSGAAPAAAAAPASAAVIPSLGEGENVVHVMVNAANIKKIDPKFYDLETADKREGRVTMTLNGQTHTCVCPKEERGKLDPTFEETFEFKCGDISDAKIHVTFFMKDNQIGDPTDFLLTALVKDSWVPKGMALPGGSCQFQLKALTFGKDADAGEEGEDDWMGILGD